MDFNLKQEGSKFNIKLVAIRAVKFWEKNRMAFFFVLLAASIFMGFRIWQQSFWGTGWSQERKQEFLDAQNNGVELKESDFEKVIEGHEARRNESLKEYQPMKDIFDAY
ncbi:MAG: hypothetical protein ACD_56C00165G0001 [uncultured bacterium]|nr:MAG: hypothetical protein ACD_56C00165G0001 [uncultured bacterium]